MEAIKEVVFQYQKDFISAAFILGLTLVTGFAVTRVLRGSLKVTQKIKGKRNKKLESAQLTRLKMIKKLILLSIYFVGISAALYQFDALRRLGTAMLASAGLIGIVTGMAARASLANVLAGLTISFVQPFKLGEEISVGDDRGVVKEITLLHTILKSDDAEIIIPNSLLSESIVKNHGKR